MLAIGGNGGDGQDGNDGGNPGNGGNGGDIRFYLRDGGRTPSERTLIADGGQSGHAGRSICRNAPTCGVDGSPDAAVNGRTGNVSNVKMP